MMTDDAAGELYVADGYGNRRVIVFDAKTGAFKRHWGAYGTSRRATRSCRPTSPDAKPSKQFSNPVHCVRLSNDGLVYVCDRANDRIQVFSKDGTFVKEFRVDAGDAAERLGVGPGAVGGRRRRSSSSSPTAPTARSSRSTARPARCSRNWAATAASPASSSGSTTSRSTPRAISTPPKSASAGARRSSSGRAVDQRQPDIPDATRHPGSRAAGELSGIVPHARLVRSPPPPPLALDNAAWQAGQKLRSRGNVPRAGRLREHCRHRLRRRCPGAGSRVRDRAVYRYRGVPQDVYEDFRQAPSKGAFFNQHIKDAYPWEQVV